MSTINFHFEEYFIYYLYIMVSSAIIFLEPVFAIVWCHVNHSFQIIDSVKQPLEKAVFLLT